MKRIITTVLTITTLLLVISSTSVLAGPPVPYLDDSQPGLNYLFSGDPNTTESTDGVPDLSLIHI